MPLLEWSDALVLDMPVMDATHEEFVVLLAEVEAAGDEALVERWRALVAHTEEHFGREDEWMRATGFAPNNCHSTQHAVVLNVMREGLQREGPDQLAMIRTMAGELAPWFVQHAQAMDAALALHLRSVDFDPARGIVRAPQALPATPMTHCGAGRCVTA